MDYGILFAALKVKQCLTDLEKDILDTWNEIQKKPFDRASAQRQIIQNNVKYPDIFAAISARPTVNIRPFTQVTQSDIQYNLKEQLTALALKEGRSAEPGSSKWCGRRNRKMMIEILRLQDAVFCENISKSDYIRDK